MKKYISISIAAFLILSFVYSANAQTFGDVSSYNISKDAIDFLQTDNVIQGYSDGTFKPDNRINRAEFTKILVATLVKNPTGSNCFTDVKNEWFAPYICTAKKLGYIGGYADGSFKPGDYINFAEASKIIDNALGVKTDTKGTKGEWFAGYVNGLAEVNAIPSSVQFFDKNISRGEMAEIIWRVKEKKTDKVSQDYESITQQFPAIKSCPALLESFKAYQGYNYAYPMTRGVMMEGATTGTGIAVPESAAKSADVIAPTAAPSVAPGVAPVTAQDYSTTNIQVAGVDEADIIKNDGKYIYLVKGGTVRIVESYPPARMAEVGTIDFTDDNFTPSEMFVNGDQLVVIGQTSSPYYYGGGGGVMKPLMMPIRPWQGSSTKVYTFDIKDRTNPKQTRVVEFDGNYFTSRRIGNSMYLVLNEYPNVWTMNDINKGEDLLPMMKDGDKAEEAIVGCGGIHYFPGFVVPNYLIVAGIPLDDASGAIDREVFLGNTDNVYSSTDNLYVATNQTDYNYYTDWNWNRDTTKTLVFKFALNNGKVDYVNRGSVPGTILNQFSMDESGDNFRIATTINSWDSEHPSGNNVYVLDKDMNTVGSLEEIAPGEKIYSTRFIGDRLYMVTFKQIDPLFVISLADPKNPTILGKLKIPGFSQYIHPYDANHIIGFGQSTQTNQYGGTVTAGFQMALFDVSDVANPKQQFTESIGDSGTYSELLTNHKALLFDKEKELLAFPITINEKVTPAELGCNKYRYDTCPSLCQQRCIPTSCTVDAQGVSNCTNDCVGPGSCTGPAYDQYTTTFSGALVYTLNLTTGFKERGRITHYNDADILKMGNYWPYDYEKAIQRIIYIGDYLYTISQSRVMANALKTVEFVKNIDLK
jgi:uncharacterized secreted protein with C-terminal beta-propeller domain